MVLPSPQQPCANGSPGLVNMVTVVLYVHAPTKAQDSHPEQMHRKWSNYINQFSSFINCRWHSTLVYTDTCARKCNSGACSLTEGTARWVCTHSPLRSVRVPLTVSHGLEGERAEGESKERERVKRGRE